jgi:hypothetical protein
MQAKRQIKIEDIYSQDTLNLLFKNKIKIFGFDFRPKSLNFLQEYKLLEFIKNNDFSNCDIFLKFGVEKDFVIKKILNDVKDICPQKERVVLDFLEVTTFEYYESFVNNFICSYREEDFNKYLNSNYFKGFIIDYKELEIIHDTRPDDFQVLIKNLALLKEKSKSFSVRIEWNENLSFLILDQIGLEFISLRVDRQVESSYRKIDEQKLSQGMNYYQNIL